MDGKKKNKLDEDSLNELRDWLEKEQNNKSIPPTIINILYLVLAFFSTGHAYKTKREHVFHLWKTLWGIGSKSEKRKGKSSTKEKKEESEEERDARLENERKERETLRKDIEKRFHQEFDILWKRRNKVKEAHKTMVFDENKWVSWRLDGLKARRGITIEAIDSYVKNWEYAGEHVEPYAPPEGEFKSYEVAAPKEHLFGHIPYSIIPPKTHRIPLGENSLDSRATRNRVVKDFSVSYQEITIEREHFTDQEGSRHYAVDPKPIAPPHIGYTFRSIINVVMFTVSFGMPINRLAKVLEGFPQGFTKNGLWGLLKYAAHRFCPLYIQLARELNKCDYLRGDDTFPKVLELQSDPDEIEKAVGVRKEVEKYFPLLSHRKNKTVKEKIQTSFITGLPKENDETSRILFYRTHRGSLGNLLDYIFKLREEKRETCSSPPEYAPKVMMTSDLSSENLPSEDIINKLGIDFEIAGCLAHARRGIFKNRKLDPEICNKILLLFEDIYSIEKYVKEELEDNSLFRVELRCRLSSRFWTMIVEEAQKLSDKWPDSSIKKAADYIIRNKEEIAKFLTNPQLEPDNNFSERNVRPEKMFLNNRLFSRTVYGRVVLDILLTMVRTTVASGVKLEDYFMWVFQTDPEFIKTNPEKYLPWNYAQKCKND